MAFTLASFLYLAKQQKYSILSGKYSKPLSILVSLIFKLSNPTIPRKDSKGPVKLLLFNLKSSKLVNLLKGVKSLVMLLIWISSQVNFSEFKVFKKFRLVSWL